jgi:hypothetical protein
VERRALTIRNVSAKDIDVDQESLPWNNADAFSVNAVAADGKVIRQNPDSALAVTARISAPHAPVTLASGESMEGRIDMGLMRIGNIPHNQDLLLLWAYPLLKDWHSDAHYMLSGITLLNARSQTPITAVPKTLPGSSLSGTSVSP